MIILLPLLAKLTVRARLIAGRGLLALGVAGLAVGVVAVPAIVVESAVTVLVGAVFLLSARISARRRGDGARGVAVDG